MLQLFVLRIVRLVVAEVCFSVVPCYGKCLNVVTALWRSLVRCRPLFGTCLVNSVMVWRRRVRLLSRLNGRQKNRCRGLGAVRLRLVLSVVRVRLSVSGLAVKVCGLLLWNTPWGNRLARTSVVSVFRGAVD